MTIQAALVSVILPTFNRADVVVRALNSVFDQTYKNLELIVIDDGSTDATSQVLKAYQDKIIYIKQANRGVSAARNAGIKKARGEYIAFIDSDDRWMPAKLDEQIKFFISHEQNKLALVCTDVEIVDTQGIHHDRRRFIPKISDCILSIIDVFKDPYLGLPTVMIKAEYLSNNIVFDEELKSAEDIDLYLRLCVHNNAGYIHKKLVEVHQSSNSLSASLSSYADNVHVITRFLDANTGLFKEYKNDVNQLMHRLLVDYATTLLWMGQNRESRAKLKLALQYKLSAKAIFLYLKSYIK
jgi:glycosyltransferase involved in cell wall biosynthesis